MYYYKVKMSPKDKTSDKTITTKFNTYFESKQFAEKNLENWDIKIFEYDNNDCPTKCWFTSNKKLQELK